jgi:hypothetical protein
MDTPAPSFFARLALAFACFGRILGNAEFARAIAALGQPAPSSSPSPAAPPPPKPAAPIVARDDTSGLAVLGMLQREGRLIDFLQEDIAAFSDADIGAAARVVHAGSRKVITQYLTLEAIRAEADGATVTVPSGFDAARIRLTGNVAGQPPYRGVLKHHGWIATDVRFPVVSDQIDPRVIAPAEIEL